MLHAHRSHSRGLLSAFLVGTALVAPVAVGAGTAGAVVPGASGQRLFAQLAAGAPTQHCSPNDSDPERFCVTADTGIPDRDAADPLSFELSAQDTSDHGGLLANESHWVQRVRFQLISTDIADARIVSSDRLPDDLILAGSPGGCAAGDDGSFSSCTAGHGTVLANVSGIPIFAGIHEISFGIQWIANVNDPNDKAWAKYLIDVDYCLPVLNPCTFVLEGQFVMTGTRGVGDLVPTLLATVFRHVTQDVPDCPVAGQTCHVNADVSLETFRIAFPGTANRLLNGTPLDTPLVTFRLPVRCGQANGQVRFSDHGTDGTNGRAVTFDITKRIVHCPTASLDRSIDVTTVALDGSTSAVQVPERTIAAYHWAFGDGESDVTTTARVRHTYAQNRDVTAALQVQDSAGALSKPVRVNLKGTNVTVRSQQTTERDVASGRLSGTGHDTEVTVALYKQRPDGAFVLIERHIVPVQDDSSYRTGFDRPSAHRCRFVTTYRGDDATGHLGSKDSDGFTC